ncbi:hypothetical protein DSO57_1033134 [Entomophthora muscae]|uniref:Uncharacterized protein n=1 Tax=Entomophthora muscae TaxID=34485 RepID=A0ACC2S2A1_9FUNG|nr:hypothetical protein DSO57_1033134 [Entomophthora muscae]
MLDSEFSPLEKSQNPPPPLQNGPGICELECELIYAADSLMVDQMKAFPSTFLWECAALCYTLSSKAIVPNQLVKLSHAFSPKDLRQGPIQAIKFRDPGSAQVLIDSGATLTWQTSL